MRKLIFRAAAKMSRGAAALWKKMDFLWDYNKGWCGFFAPAKLNRYFHKRGARARQKAPRAFDKVFCAIYFVLINATSINNKRADADFSHPRTRPYFFADNNKLILKEPARKIFAHSYWLLRLKRIKAFSPSLFKK